MKHAIIVPASPAERLSMMFSQRSRCAFPLVLHTATPVHQFQVVVCSQRNERVPAFLDRPSDCVDRSWPRIALHPKPLTIAEQRTDLSAEGSFLAAPNVLRKALSWASHIRNIRTSQIPISIRKRGQYIAIANFMPHQ